MMKMRPYQGDGYRDIWREWEEYQLLMFVLATGGGKTVTFVEVIKKILSMGKTVTLIAHRKELIMQAWQTLYSNQVYAGIIMAGVQPKYELPCQVCSIQTLVGREVASTDYYIIDEGHHTTVDNTYGKIIKKNPSAKYLLVTATPYRLSGEGFRRLHPYKETRLILNRNLRELTEDGWLVPLRYFNSSVPDLSDVHIKKGDYVEEEAQKAMELVPIIDSYLEHAAGKSGVVFTVNVDHSIHTVQRYLHAGVPAAHVDGNTPDAERAKIMSDFRCQLIKVVSNVGIITEGSDFPGCEFIQLARPTKSLGLYLQMIGRVTRPLGGIVDKWETAVERRVAIHQSAKPWGIVLDNAGCWIDNNLPEYEHNWERYFIGKKQFKVPDEEGQQMEMMVFVAMDAQGQIVKTSKPKEIEGMRLIEVTTETRRKIVNLLSIKEFDRQYAMFKKLPKIKKPGYVAAQGFFDYCHKEKILLVDEVWDYLKRKLVDEIQNRVDEMANNRSRNPGAYPHDMYMDAVKTVESMGVSKTWLAIERKNYERDNQEQVKAARFASGDKKRPVDTKLF